MKKPLIPVFACLLAVACTQKNSVIVFDQASAGPATLETVATGWELLPVDESESLLGTVDWVKRYGTKTFIKNGRYPDGVKIVILDENRPYATLDAYGRGPGEYQDLDFFAFREESSELVINDRRFKGFRIYHVPEMTWVADEPMEDYLETFEALDATHSIFCPDPDDVETKVLLWNHATHEAEAGYDLDFVEASLAPELHETRRPDGSVLFGLPGRQTRIVQADASGFSVVGEAVFTPDAFASVWDVQELEKLYTAFEDVMESGKDIALGAEAPVMEDGRMAFWYFTGRNDPWRVAVAGPDGARCYSELRVEGYPEPLQPAGTDGKQWISVLLLELLEDIPAPQGELYPRLRALKDAGYETVLLFYSVI